MTNLHNVLKSKDITLPTRVCIVKAMVFPVVMYGCESWTIKKAECRRIDAFELWCWKTLGSPLDSKEIQPVNPKGNQPWIFIGRTEAEAEAPILGLHGAKSWLIGEDPEAGKDWRQKEKGKQRMRWLDSILDSMDMNLSKLQEDSTCHGASKPTCHNYWACALEPALCNKRSHRNEKPTHCK